MIVSAAIQEDVDVIALSIMSGAHNHLVPEIARLLSKQKAEDIVVVLGGIIPQGDFDDMLEAGVKAIFTPGASLQEITECVHGLGEKKRDSEVA